MIKDSSFWPTWQFNNEWNWDDRGNLDSLDSEGIMWGLLEVLKNTFLLSAPVLLEATFGQEGSREK